MRWAARRSASSAPAIGSAWPTGWPLSPEWDAVAAVREGYKASYIYYSVASDLADCQRVPTWGVYRAGEKIEHPLMEMIRRPNTRQTWGALLELWDLDKSLAGNAYGRWMMIGDRVVVWRLRPDRVNVREYKSGPLKGQIERYVYSITGDFLNPDEEYKPEEILHFKFADPGNDHFGLAPLRAAARLVNTSNSGLEWHENTIKRGAKPDMILSPKEHLEANQHKTLLSLLREQVQGPENAHRPLIPSEPMEILLASMTPADLDFLSIFGPYEDGVCKVLHVDPDAVGKTGSTYENKNWAHRMKWEGPVKSRSSEMNAVMNLGWREVFGTCDAKNAGDKDISIGIDWSGTPGAQAARMERLEKASQVWVSSGMPWNQLNEDMDLGLAPYEGGDVGYIPRGMLPVGMEAAVPVSEGRSTRAIKLDTEEQRAAAWRAKNETVESWARKIAPKVSEVFAAQRKACVKAVEAGHVDMDPYIDEGRGAWEKLVSSVMRAVIEDVGAKTAESLNPGRSQVGSSPLRPFTALSGHRAETQTGTDFDPWNNLTQEWVTTQTAEHVSLIQTTTKTAIRKAVLAGLDEGESMVQIAKRVKEKFNEYEGGISSYRSMMIARTEVHDAAGFAQHESARQSGVAQEKHWLDAGDDRVRDSHVANTAEGWIPFDQAYQNGAMYPGDGTDDVQCRCVEMYRQG